jgi:hypothetical protein
MGWVPIDDRGRVFEWRDSSACETNGGSARRRDQSAEERDGEAESSDRQPPDLIGADDIAGPWLDGRRGPPWRSQGSLDDGRASQACRCDSGKGKGG